MEKENDEQLTPELELEKAKAEKEKWRAASAAAEQVVKQEREETQDLNFGRAWVRELDAIGIRF